MEQHPERAREASHAGGSTLGRTVVALVCMSIVATAWLGASADEPSVEAANAQDPAPAPSPPQNEATSTAPSSGARMNATFSAAQLEQIVAPIALYPDALFAQVCMAATYPLEVVEAARWIARHEDLKGAALEEALAHEDWDPSVKSVVGLPEVLARMDADLDWMQDLGDAFLSQREELLDAAQRMRKRARDAGNLQTTAEQSVTRDEDAIVIQPADPQVVYVPVYSPVVVYGPTWHSTAWYYPSLYFAPAPGAAFFWFSSGYPWGPALWSQCDWHHHVVHVHVVRYARFCHRTSAAPVALPLSDSPDELAPWTHDAVHRRGVNYRDPKIAERYGGAPGMRRIRRADVPSTPSSRAGDEPVRRPLPQNADEPTRDRPPAPPVRRPDPPRPERTPPPAPAPRAEPRPRPEPPPRPEPQPIPRPQPPPPDRPPPSPPPPPDRPPPPRSGVVEHAGIGHSGIERSRIDR